MELKALASELWGTNPLSADVTERHYGKGRILCGTRFGGESKEGEDGGNGVGAAKWIWHKEGNPAVAAPMGARYFRRVVQVDSAVPIDSARLLMTADNSFECWINGKAAGSGDDWSRLYESEHHPVAAPGIEPDCREGGQWRGRSEPGGHHRACLRSSITMAAWSRCLRMRPGSPLSRPRATGGRMPGRPAGGAQRWCWGQPAWRLGAISSTPAPGLTFTRTSSCWGKYWISAVWRRTSRARPAELRQSLRFIHKHMDDAEVYFVANKTPEARQGCLLVPGPRPAARAVAPADGRNRAPGGI